MKRLLAVTLIALVPGTALGTADVPSAYRMVAMAHGIPPAVLYAIALTESGRALATTADARPWPWSANFGGRGRFFESRSEAWAAIQDYLGSGRRSVDIGLMQVNWRYHHTQFHSVWDALDPHSNLIVAADILTACYRRLGDWWESVGCYHAPSNTERAAAYRRRVRAHWRRLVV